MWMCPQCNTLCYGEKKGLIAIASASLQCAYVCNLLLCILSLIPRPFKWGVWEEKQGRVATHRLLNMQCFRIPVV